MIKLVIADDEYFIRARLSKIISEKRQNIDITDGYQNDFIKRT